MKKFITNNLIFFLSAIAIVAIVEYVSTYFGVDTSWWYTPALALITALGVVVLPSLTRKFKGPFSIICTGLTLWGSIFLPNQYYLFVFIVLIVGIKDIVLRKEALPVGELIFDVAASALTAWCWFKFQHTLVRVAILMVAYLVTTYVTFSKKSRE